MWIISIFRGCGLKQKSPNLKQCFKKKCLEELRKTTKNFRLCSSSSRLISDRLPVSCTNTIDSIHQRATFYEMFVCTAELQSSGLILTTSYSDMQKIRIIGLFFENWLHWQSEVWAERTVVEC